MPPSRAGTDAPAQLPRRSGSPAQAVSRVTVGSICRVRRHPRLLDPCKADPTRTSIHLPPSGCPPPPPWSRSSLQSSLRAGATRPSPPAVVFRGDRVAPTQPGRLGLRGHERPLGQVSRKRPEDGFPGGFAASPAGLTPDVTLPLWTPLSPPCNEGIERNDLLSPAWPPGAEPHAPLDGSPE